VSRSVSRDGNRGARDEEADDGRALLVPLGLRDESDVLRGGPLKGFLFIIEK